MQGATFHLSILSLQTPMCETDENRNNGNLLVQNAIGSETLAAPMYEDIPNQLYPPVNNVDNPMPISSTSSEPLGKLSFILTAIIPRKVFPALHTIQHTHTSSSCFNLSKPELVETNSVAIQTEVETWDS